MLVRRCRRRPARRRIGRRRLRSLDVTAYQALAADLRDRIVSGEFQPGDRLPIEPDLCVRYGVSRSTVREALRLLASQNLIRTVRGTTGGSFVAHPDPDHISAYLET